MLPTMPEDRHFMRRGRCHSLRLPFPILFSSLSPFLIQRTRIFESVIAMLIYLNIYSTISSILRKEKMIGYV